MTKKIYMSVLILCNFSHVYANNAQHNLSAISIGLETGVDHYNTNHTSDYNTFSIINQNSLMQIHDHSNCISASHKKHSMGIGVNLGYTFLFNHLYLGITGDLSYSSKTNSNHEGHLHPHVKTSNLTYGIKTKIGYHFECINTAIYGITGLKWNKIELSINHPKSISNKTHVRNPMFVYGIGFESFINKKISFFTEYEHAYRKSSSKLDLDVHKLHPDAVSQTYYVKHKVSVNSCKLGFRYHF